MFEKEAEEYAGNTYEMCSYSGLPYASDRRAREQAFQDGAEFGYNKANEWHYVKDGKDLPLEAGLHIRVVLHNGNEYICETDYYEPSEDEIGFGHLLIQLYSNDEWIDDNDVYAWCELSIPPKKE